MSAIARRAASGTPSQNLRMNFAAVRVSFTWLGVRKSLNTEQKAQAAESFGAEGQYLSAAKKLLDTSHEAFQQVTAGECELAFLDALCAAIERTLLFHLEHHRVRSVQLVGTSLRAIADGLLDAFADFFLRLLG